MVRYVIIPGIDNSDADHWQTEWERSWGPRAARIAVASWTSPELDDWVTAIRTATAADRGPIVLVAHSLGCLAAAHALSEPPAPTNVAAAFLVAPPDPTSPAFPAAAPTFVRAAPEPLDVPTLVVASDDDPYCSREASQELARRWRASWLSVGPFGHLNVASGVGGWDVGRQLLTAFVAGTGLYVEPGVS